MNNLIGRKFGNLTVLSKGLSSTNRQLFWNCSCDCGTVTSVRGDRLLSGKTKSCGCLMEKYIGRGGNMSGGSIHGMVYMRYKGAAKRDNRTFNIPLPHFKNLILQNCYYCDSKPSTKVCKGTEVLLYNGIDRVDNSRGYEVDNIVPCCEICNRGKRSMDFSLFTDWISRISGFSLVGMISG